MWTPGLQRPESVRNGHLVREAPVERAAGLASGCRAILLDFGGTLDADGVAWKERMLGFYQLSGLDIPVERFDPAFYAADDALVGTVPRRLGLTGTAERLVSGLHRALGIGVDVRARGIARRFAEDAIGRARSRRPLLSALGRRYRLAVVSNFYGNLEAVCEECGIRELFSAVVDSEVVGCGKPDPRIFRAGLDALGVAPADAVFVGDSLRRDMAGARGLGMPHVWLAPGASGSGGCCPGDAVIRALGDLEGLV